VLIVARRADDASPASSRRYVTFIVDIAIFLFCGIPSNSCGTFFSSAMMDFPFFYTIVVPIVFVSMLE
jgi:hypothetical protein